MTKELETTNLSSKEIQILKALNNASGKSLEIQQLEDMLEMTYSDLRLQLNDLLILGIIEESNGYISLTPRAYK